MIQNTTVAPDFERKISNCSVEARMKWGGVIATEAKAAGCTFSEMYVDPDSMVTHYRAWKVRPADYGRKEGDPDGRK